MQILLVADNNTFAGCIEHGLVRKGFVVTVTSESINREITAPTGNYDLVILDLAASEQSGLEVCNVLRRQGLQTPILLLADVDDVDDCILGLDMGADDYLLKPFDLHALLACIRVMLGRKGGASVTYLRARDLVLDPVTRQVRRGEEDVTLTPREYTLLEYMMRHQGRVLSREVLRDQVWRYDFDTGTNVVDVYINYLRRKIDRFASSPMIKTVRGVGYALQANGCI